MERKIRSKTGGKRERVRRGREIKGETKREKGKRWGKRHLKLTNRMMSKGTERG